MHGYSTDRLSLSAALLATVDAVSLLEGIVFRTRPSTPEKKGKAHWLRCRILMLTHDCCDDANLTLTLRTAPATRDSDHIFLPRVSSMRLICFTSPCAFLLALTLFETPPASACTTDYDCAAGHSCSSAGTCRLGPKRLGDWCSNATDCRIISSATVCKSDRCICADGFISTGVRCKEDIRWRLVAFVVSLPLIALLLIGAIEVCRRRVASSRQLSRLTSLTMEHEEQTPILDVLREHPRNRRSLAAQYS